MPNLTVRISSFVKLGNYLCSLKESEKISESNKFVQEKLAQLNKTIEDACHFNGWFNEPNVRQMMVSLGNSLKEEKLMTWVSSYLPQFEKERIEKTVALVLAGNIPAVGFHDFLSVLMSGNRLLAKLSSSDEKLLPAIADLLVAIEPGFEGKIRFTKEPLKNFDAVIATGSNNSSRYFEYYFGKYPNIIRKNRNGVAVIAGDETIEDLARLADDIFSYYGLGCRNVSKIFVPEAYDFSVLLNILGDCKTIVENHKYINNYEYNKALFLVNARPHFDTGNLLLVEEEQIASPVSVVNYAYFQDEQILKEQLIQSESQIQCIVSSRALFLDTVGFGKSQQPELWDYADGVDTMEFLLSID